MKSRSLKATLTVTVFGTGLLAASLAWPVSRSAAESSPQADVAPIRGHFSGAAGLEAARQLRRVEPRAAVLEGGAQPTGERPHANPVFARKVTGTWVEWWETGQTHMSISADGTMEWFGSWFFGDGSGNFLDGPVYGTWRQTGPRELTTTEVGLLFNGDGSFYATGRVVEVFTFDEDFQSFSYAGSEDIFLPDQNPTDPDAVPDESFGFAGGPINRLNFMD